MVDLSYDQASRLYAVAGSAATRFLYDGGDIIGEYNGAGTLLRRYVHGPGIDEPLVCYNGGAGAAQSCTPADGGAGAKFWLHADARGSVIALSDASGNVVAKNTYDPYGEPDAGNTGLFQQAGGASHGSNCIGQAPPAANRRAAPIPRLGLTPPRFSSRIIRRGNSSSRGGRVMAFLERLKLRRGAGGEPAAASPFASPIAPKLKARITAFGQLFFPGHGARRLEPTAAPESVPPDPAKILFPVGASLDEESGGDGSLSGRLRYSAGAIMRRQSDLAGEAARVAEAVGARLGGAVSMTAWTMRFLIALAWGFFAAELAWARFTGSTAGIVGLGPVAADDIVPLIVVFGLAASAGLIAVFLGAAAVSLAGNADNRRIRERATLFGDRAGGLALQFDAKLDELRRSMDGRANAVDAVADLSRAHLTALEAAVFFRDIQFLTDDEDAAAKFRGYLARVSGGGGGTGKPQAFVLGILTGMIAMAFLYGPRIEAPVVAELKYPAVQAWILLGGLAYLIAGLIAETLSGLVTAGVAREAREEALDAVRSGFVARGAPRVEDVIRRIEDALDVYKARARAPRGAGGEATNADDVPAWRKPPEGPRFVDAGFQAAPKTFLVGPETAGEDGKGRRSRKIF